MPIPSFTIDGVLPPYVGPHGPGGRAEDMSPYAVTALEVVSTLGDTDKRKEILLGWLDHRAALRKLGFTNGFQWLDGSFVEKKDPNDLDVVSFTIRPTTAKTDNDIAILLRGNPELFARAQVKAKFKLDAFFIDLDGSPEGMVSATRYFLGLFSHRRGDDLWKGMLQVRLENEADDKAALAVLTPPPAAASVPAGGATP